MNLVDTRETSIEDHIQLCRSRTNKQHVKYPQPGKNFEEFKNYRLNNKLLIFACADGECSLPTIKKPDNNFLENEYCQEGEYFNDAMKKIEVAI